MDSKQLIKRWVDSVDNMRNGKLEKIIGEYLDEAENYSKSYSPNDIPTLLTEKVISGLASELNIDEESALTIISYGIYLMGEDAISVVHKCLSNGNPFSLNSLVFFGRKAETYLPEIRMELLEQYAETDIEFIEEYLLILAWIGTTDQKEFEFFVKYLDFPNEEIRSQAVTTLYMICFSEYGIKKALDMAINDESELVRKNAVSVLNSYKRCGGEAKEVVIKSLIGKIKNGNLDIAESAASIIVEKLYYSREDTSLEFCPYLNHIIDPKNNYPHKTKEIANRVREEISYQILKAYRGE
ncbi:HEAT repeat domain-containing protein [Rossellomorea aquimaris]|uniref:HEAT repeat domain-containing protein n=1 Tax=Rossellomorea aquimaris TaxID=189382 RepID=UPI0007D04F81|nr:HEAT repeat domain-containing protein [Rossellomorea aquimaris]